MARIAGTVDDKSVNNERTSQMKGMPLITMLTAVLLLPCVTNGQQPKPVGPGDRSFVQTNTWWNLYFATENHPLRRGGGSIHAVKIVEIDQTRPSWIKITFPKVREEHLSILGPAARARDRDDVAIEAALAEWETTVSEWKVMWVNLDFVVYVTSVQSGGDKPPPRDPVSDGP